MKKTSKVKAPGSRPASRPLSERERQFVERFMGDAHGNGTRACELAGYSKTTAAAQASRLLRKRKIQEAIEERRKADPLVLDREALQQFWSNVVNGSIQGELRDRLKASELLAKSQAVFVERHSLEAAGDFTALILAAARKAEGPDHD